MHDGLLLTVTASLTINGLFPGLASKPHEAHARDAGPSCCDPNYVANSSLGGGL
jgi:hypothetical protein